MVFHGKTADRKHNRKLHLPYKVLPVKNTFKLRTKEQSRIVTDSEVQLLVK